MTTRSAIFVLMLGAASTAHAAEPAARLMPAKPLAETPRAVISRGSTPDFRPFDPSRSITPGAPPASSPSTPKDDGLRLRPLTPPRPTNVPEKPGYVTNTWNEVKEFVVGKPAPTPPRAIPHQQGIPSYVDPAALRPNSVLPTAAAFPGQYAGPPAYRWYGWGTTTPGGNAYAPTGQYPRGSANWYAQTGATPGAFPVPIMNPMRPLPGAEPPTYVSSPPAPFVPPPVIVIPSSPVMTGVPTIVAPLLGSTVELIPAPVVEDVPVFGSPGVVPTLVVPSGPPIPVGPPIVIQSGATEAPVVPTIKWQAVDDETIRFAPIGEVKTASVPRAPTLSQVIQTACQDRATVSGVRHTGPKKLLVRLTATTEANARAAAEAISRVPELKPYEVGFETSVGGR